MANNCESIFIVNDLDDIFEEFSVKFRESFKNIIKEEGYLKCAVEKKLVSNVDNFSSLLYEVDITGETSTGVKVTQLFIKKSIPFDKITLSTMTEMYSRELFIYNKLSEIFLELQKAANIPDREMFRFLKSYNSDVEAIIMENVSKKGFKSYNGKQVVLIKYAELSIVELAKFHALSYVLKIRNPKYFDDNVKVIQHPYNTDSDWDGFVHNVCAATAQVMEGEAKDKIKNYAPRMLQTFQKFMKDNVPSNGCLCHGDYKILNILVKEVDGEAVEVQPIDYQLLYYGNPIDDFLFFMFTGTDREFRRKHLSNLKDLYFESFAKFLKYFNINVDSSYSRQEFEKDYEERLELGLVIGLYLAAFTFAHVDEGFDVHDRSMSELAIVPDEMFEHRVRGIVEDYIEWGIL